MTRMEMVDVDGGAVPVTVQGPHDTSGAPALVVVPSIFGPAPDLVARLVVLAEDTLVAIPDPFWRTGEGPIAYDQGEKAMARLAEYDFARCATEMAAVAQWARSASNGHVVAVGICFGGSFVLRLAANDQVNGVVTWHGSRMETALDLVPRITCPVRHHLGGADHITPPEVIDAIRSGFADHPDCKIIVHDGAEHGFSHDGASWDEVAYAASFADVVSLLDLGR